VAEKEPVKNNYSIILSYNNLKELFVLPVNPPDIQISNSGGGKTFEVSGLGEINVIQSPKLAEVSFKSIFPNQKYSFVTSEKLYDPTYYVNMILKWMNTKHPIRLVFVGETFDLNLAVSIEKFEWQEIAGSADIEYSISFKKFVFYGARQVIIKNNKTTSKTKARSTDKQVPKTYKLVAGDTLIKVARLQLGNEKRWREIQKLNGITEGQLRKLPIGMLLKLPG
jgi:hypothetical protein